MLEKLGQRGSTAPGYASRSVFKIIVVVIIVVVIMVAVIVVVIIDVVIIVVVIVVIIIFIVVMIIVSARMTTVLCGREASAGKLRSAGRLEPKRLCFSGSKPRYFFW